VLRHGVTAFAKDYSDAELIKAMLLEHEDCGSMTRQYASLDPHLLEH